MGLLDVIGSAINPMNSLDPVNATGWRGGGDSSASNAINSANQLGGSLYSNGSSTNASDADITSALGLSSDNPNSAATIAAVKSLMGQGYNLGAAIGGITGKLQASDPFIGDLLYSNAGAESQLNAAKSAYGTSQTWEGQNAGTTPAQRALNTQITDTANTFQTNMPKLEYSLTAQAAEAQKSQLATAIQGTKANSNAMGLLYGNYEQGAENNQVQNAASNVTKAAAGINQTVSQENEGLQNNAIQMQNTIQAMNQAGAGNNTNLTNQYNNIAEQQTALNNQAEATMGGAFGSVAGSAAFAANNTNSNVGYGSGVAPGSTVPGLSNYNPMPNAPQFGQSAGGTNQDLGLGLGS